MVLMKGGRSVYRSWAFEGLACIFQIFQALKGVCEMSCIEMWLFENFTHVI